MRRLRTSDPHLGKDQLAVVRSHRLTPTFGLDHRTPHRPRPDKMRPTPPRIDRLGRPKPRKPQGVNPALFQCPAVDIIERVRDGMAAPG